jgi:DNA-binding response OmpR family regulator
MYPQTQSVQRGETNRPFWPPNFSIDRLDFRSALVIEESEVLRRSIVEHIKKRGWIAHGIKRAEQALPILQHILYHLIVIDCTVSGMTATEFVRIIHESGKWQATRVAVITRSRGRSSVTEIKECGAFLVRRSVWREALSKLLANLDVRKQSDEEKAVYYREADSLHWIDELSDLDEAKAAQTLPGRYRL